MLVGGLTAREAAKLWRARARAAAPAPALAPALAEGAIAAPPLAHRRIPSNIPRILVPTRGSPALLRFAADYAAAKHGAVMVLFVREVAIKFRERDKSLATEDMTMERDQEALKILHEADDICRKAGVPMVPLYVVHDSPAEIILDYAATYGVDSLVMGVSRRGAFWRTLRGDVLQEVMQYLPDSIPLLIHS